MIKKPEGCTGCVLHQKGKGYCKDKAAKRPRFLFIGETPDKTEVTNNEPFSGKAGFVLKNWLIRAVSELQLASEKGEIAYANILRCLPPEIQGRAYPKGEDRALAEAHCRRYDDIPESVHSVVLFGDAPQRYYFPEILDAEDASDRRLGRDVKGVMGRVGREYEKDGKRWIFAPSPAAILRQPALVQHGQMSLKIASNSEHLLEPDYVKWEAAMQVLHV
jgi:uracil-DNA glycosylase family 4